MRIPITISLIFITAYCFSQVRWSGIIAPIPKQDTFSLTLRNATPGYSARDGAETFERNDTIFQVNGWEVGCVTDSTCWISLDTGLTWTNAGNTGMPKSHTIPLVYKAPYWYCIPADLCNTNAQQDDVYRSANGRTWTKIGDIGWTVPRGLTGMGVIGDSLYAFGGQSSTTTPTVYRSMYRSLDGITWTLSCSACLPSDVGNLSGTFVSWKNRIWMVAGGVYQTSPTYINKVYKYVPGGTGWLNVGTFPLSGYYPKAFVHDGKLFVIGIGNGSGNNKILAYTRNGETWTQIQTQPNVTGVLFNYHAVSVTSFGDRKHAVISAGNGLFGSSSTAVSNDVFLIKKIN